MNLFLNVLQVLGAGCYFVLIVLHLLDLKRINSRLLALEESDK